MNYTQEEIETAIEYAVSCDDPYVLNELAAIKKAKSSNSDSNDHYNNIISYSIAKYGAKAKLSLMKKRDK